MQRRHDLQLGEWTFKTETAGQISIGCSEISFDEKVLRLIKDGLTSQTEIADELDVNKSTVSRSVKRLIDKRLVETDGKKGVRPRGIC